MSDDNKRNLQYFEAPSMKELYDTMETWQVENKKRLLSVSIERDAGKFCCIALTNPTEVIIVDAGFNYEGAKVRNNRLIVEAYTAPEPSIPDY